MLLGPCKRVTVVPYNGTTEAKPRRAAPAVEVAGPVQLGLFALVGA